MTKDLLIGWILGLSVCVGLLMWAADRDAKMNAWAAEYEACVEREYGMTPATYYKTVGTYPICEK